MERLTMGITFNFLKTEVKIHWSILIMLLLLTAPNLLKGDYVGAIFGVKIFVTIFTLVTIHEYGHIFAARYFGYTTERMTLHFFGGLAESSGTFKTPKELFIIGIAGPATNFVLFFVGLLFVDFGRIEISSLPTHYALYFCLANFMLFVFNMLPIAPMDGGHVLTSTCWTITRSKEMASYYAGFISIVVAAVAIGMFAYLGLYMAIAIIAFMAYTNIYQIKAGNKIKGLIKGIKKRIENSGESANIVVKHVNIGDENYIKASYYNTRLDCPVVISFVKENP